jgi:GNAT superfamily N-acetyltransferase
VKIRAAEPSDVEAMVRLSESFRESLSSYSPVFWRMADDSLEKHAAWFRILLASPNAIVLVADASSDLSGFVIANLVQAPPVYAPGGPVCQIDDYCIAADADWSGVGAKLLESVEVTAHERGAVLSIVICPHLAGDKRDFLWERGFEVTSEWHVREL